MQPLTGQQPRGSTGSFNTLPSAMPTISNSVTYGAKLNRSELEGNIKSKKDFKEVSEAERSE